MHFNLFGGNSSISQLFKSQKSRYHNVVATLSSRIPSFRDEKWGATPQSYAIQLVRLIDLELHVHLIDYCAISFNYCKTLIFHNIYIYTDLNDIENIKF